MKRVFAHLGFSAAVMLLILNFFSVTFAYVALGVVLAALCLVLSVPRLRQGVSVWLCLVGAVVACVTFIVGVHAAYLRCRRRQLRTVGHDRFFVRYRDIQPVKFAAFEEIFKLLRRFFKQLVFVIGQHGMYLRRVAVAELFA